jgi:hypothetical protein
LQVNWVLNVDSLLGSVRCWGMFWGVMLFVGLPWQYFASIHVAFLVMITLILFPQEVALAKDDLAKACRATFGHASTAHVVQGFEQYIKGLPRRGLTASESKRLAEYEAVCKMAWDASFSGSSGVARCIYNALSGVAGSKMLKQAEKDIVVSPAPFGSDATASRSSGGMASRGGGGFARGRGMGRVANRAKDCYGCGEKGHVRRDCPKSKPS